MDSLSGNDIDTLLNAQESHCVSIYMPTDPEVSDRQSNGITFKNLLREAEHTLHKCGASQRETADLLGPARGLVSNGFSWHQQAGGFAAFTSQSTFLHYRLPLAFGALVLVGRRFHLKPILPLVTSDERFLVLALSQNKARLVQCTPYQATELDIQGLPEGIAEALKYDDPERQLQFHTRTQPATGGRSAIYHGHGAGTEDARETILRYFQHIDKALRTVLRDHDAPLVLATVKYLHPIYREANTYAHLVDDCVAGNPDALSAVELRQRAWPIVQPVFRRAYEEDAAHYRQLAGTGRVSTDVEKVVPAAHYGRVATLFAALDDQQWGTFDPHSGDVELHEDPAPGDEDLLDAAAVHAFQNGAAVHAVPRSDVPADASLAAVFRY